MRRLREVDERRGVDVDVPVAGFDREPAGPPDLLGHRLRIGGVLLGVELVVVALDEHRAAPAGGDRAGEHGRRIVDRALERVGLLAARELQDHRPDVGGLGRLVDRPRHVERLGADVDGRHGEPETSPRPRASVQLLDARRVRAERLARLPDEPLRRRRSWARRSLKAAVQARSRIAPSRKAASSSMTSGRRRDARRRRCGSAGRQARSRQWASDGGLLGSGFADHGTARGGWTRRDRLRASRFGSSVRSVPDMGRPPTPGDWVGGRWSSRLTRPLSRRRTRDDTPRGRECDATDDEVGRGRGWVGGPKPARSRGAPGLRPSA